MKRKKILLLFLPVVLALNTAVAQQRFRAGFTAGGVASDIPGTDNRDNDVDYNKLGFTIGGIVNTSLTSKITLQMEINYIQKGASQLPDTSNNGYFKLSLNYLEVPILLRRRMHFTIFRKPISKFDLEAGASIGRMFSSSYLVNNYPSYLDPTTLNKTDVSLLAGLDYNFTSNFYLCIRYTNSVVPAIKSDSPHTSLQFLPYTFNHGDNVVFQLTLKFVFGNTGEDPADKGTDNKDK